jgi:hypothetical protein
MRRAASRDPIYRRRRYSPEIIELCVRWYITYRLSYRDLVAMMAERGVSVSHTTLLRWVLRYVPEYERRWARFARPGGWMRRRSRCEGAGTTSIVRSIEAASQCTRISSRSLPATISPPEC